VDKSEIIRNQTEMHNRSNGRGARVALCIHPLRIKGTENQTPKTQPVAFIDYLHSEFILGKMKKTMNTSVMYRIDTA
jgi:hypothetical protein